jgi:hypothetical protein
MIETMFGLARLGYTNSKGMPSPLQLALVAQEFSVLGRRDGARHGRTVYS